jgi:hypothetical protein
MYISHRHGCRQMKSTVQKKGKKQNNKRERKFVAAVDNIFWSVALYTNSVDCWTLTDNPRTNQRPCQYILYRKADRQLFVSIAQIWQDTTATHSRQSFELIERGATKSPPGQKRISFNSFFYIVEASWVCVCMYEARAIQTSSSSSSAERRVSINMLAQKKTPHLSRNYLHNNMKLWRV